MEPIGIGIIGLIALLGMLVISMPVGFAMALIGWIGFGLVVSWPAAGQVLIADYYDTITNYSLTVIPLFVLMGQVVYHSGMSGRLFEAVQAWFGRIQGGLAMATIGACAIFGAVCGSGPATAATMTTVALPEMRKRGYDPALASGVIAAGGSLGMLVPPSVVLIVYGILTEISINQLFKAAIIPALLVVVIFMAYIFIKCTLNPKLAPLGEKVPLRVKFKALGGIIETILLFTLVMGGMFGGLFTPTEAAAVGAFGSIVISFSLRRLTINKLLQACRETIRTSCMVLVIVAGATVFGHFMQVTELPSLLANWLTTLPLPRLVVFAMIVLFYVLSGCFLDALAVVLLTTSIFLPVVKAIGYDPVWFGIIIVLVTQIGVISPPVGVNVYVVRGMSRTIPLPVIFRGAAPYIALLLLAVAILMLFPAIIGI